MTEGQFRQQIDYSWRMLKKWSLVSSRVYYPEYNNFTAAQVRHLSYENEWKYLMERQLLDFQLTDNSLFAFKRLEQDGVVVCSYSYYESPYAVVSYEEFLEKQGINAADVGDLFKEEYNQHIMGGAIKGTVTPVRYDYAPQQYTEGRHPASHVHFGHGSQIRVGTKRILGSLSFVLFIIRQYYPNIWQQFLKNPIPKQCLGSIRKQLADVPKEYFNDKDVHELILD